MYVASCDLTNRNRVVNLGQLSLFNTIQQQFVFSIHKQRYNMRVFNLAL